MLWTRLIDIVPKTYTNVRDIEAVLLVSDANMMGSLDDLDDLDDVCFSNDAYKVYLNFFVQTCDVPMLAEWERLLGIEEFPDDALEEEDRIANRRANILATLQSVWNLTLAWLTTRLTNLLGSKDDFTIEIFYNTYEVVVNILSGELDVVNAVLTLVRRVIPAHLDLFVGQMLEGEADGTPYVGGFPEVALEYDVFVKFVPPVPKTLWSHPLGWAPLL
jgi:hypothetical protein